MRNTSLRFANAALWPLTIWTSLTHLEDHPADDYVERTSPNVGTAIAFWIGVLGAVAVWFASRGAVRGIDVDGDVSGVRVFNSGFDGLFGMLLVFLPVVYVIGFWLFATRDEAYPR